MKDFFLLQNWWQFLIIAIVCYFVGCLNFAVFIARAKHRDITKLGSGNPGTMNMSRELGIKAGIATFVCDALKGALPAVVCYFIYRNYLFYGSKVVVSDFIRYFCGIFVALGHIFPVTMRFKGGKGIACTLGLLWGSLSCESAWWALIGLGIAAVLVGFILWTKWGALGSLLGVTGCSIIQMIIFFLRYANLAFNAYLVAVYVAIFTIDVLTWLAHRNNLLRLFSGEEHRTNLRKKKKNV